MRKSFLALILLALTASVLTPQALAASGKRSSFAGSLGLKVAKGEIATLRVVNLRDGSIAAARDLPRSGSFNISLPGGSYLAIGTVVSRQQAAASRQLAVTLKPGQKRKRARLTARLRAKSKKKAKQTTAAYKTERGRTRPGNAVGVEPFDGPDSGDMHWLAQGAADLITADLVNNVAKDCPSKVKVVEVNPERVKALRAEQELGRSPYADRSNFPPTDMIVPDRRVRGTITPDGNAQVTIVDGAGNTIGSIEQQLGDDWPGDLEQLTTKLAAALCNPATGIAVKLHIDAKSDTSDYSGAATLDGTLTASRGKDDHWRASGPLAFTGITFQVKNDCPIINPVGNVTAWSVDIYRGADKQLKVDVSIQGYSASGALHCPGTSPYPRPDGVAVLADIAGIGPLNFGLPAKGGTQQLSGDAGHANSGQITVTVMGGG